MMRGLVRLAGLALAGCAAATPSSSSSPPRLCTPPAIASADYESTPTFTPDGREMYFMRADPAFRTYRLFWSRCENGAWGAPRTVPFAAPEPAVEADPGMTPDGRRLYYISTRHAPDSDDFDIWYVDRAGDGWSAPKRLPAPVNSPASELLPRVDGEGRLYFGSARPGGHGQGDIYVATEQDGVWRVENVGPPVNTAAFEYEAEISRDGRTMIVVANPEGRSHLYRYERTESGWIERGRISARTDVFQVGPLLSPRAQRLLLAQAEEERSGEMLLVDLVPDPDEAWPPDCREMP